MPLPRVFAPLLTAIFFPGCALFHLGQASLPDNPLPEYRRVVVVPFPDTPATGTLLTTNTGFSGTTLAEMFCSELTRFQGFELIRTHPLLEAAREEKWDLSGGPDTYLKLARKLGADAVVVGAITEFTPYYPPRVVMALAVYLVPPRGTQRDLTVLEQQGRPFPLFREDPRQPFFGREKMYDASERDTRGALTAYSLLRFDNADRAAEDELFLYEPESYLRFVMNQAVREWIAAAEAWKKKQETAPPPEESFR